MFVLEEEKRDGLEEVPNHVKLRPLLWSGLQGRPEEVGGRRTQVTGRRGPNIKWIINLTEKSLDQSIHLTMVLFLGSQSHIDTRPLTVPRCIGFDGPRTTTPGTLLYPSLLNST